VPAVHPADCCYIAAVLVPLALDLLQCDLNSDEPGNLYQGQQWDEQCKRAADIDKKLDDQRKASASTPCCCMWGRCGR
jgi:hypothetical protein